MNRRLALKGLGLSIFSSLIAGGAYYFTRVGTPQRTQLLIGGSTIVFRFMEKLANAFSKKNSDVDLLVEGGHSYGGFIALDHGTIDIAMTSSDFIPDELNLNFRSYLIGMEAVAIVVHPNSLVNSISIDNARRIFEGKIKNWNEIGGPNAPIKIFSRLDGSTTKITIEQILLGGDSVNERFKELSSSKEMAQEIALDPLSIGFLTSRNFTSKIKPLEIDGVGINTKTLLLGLYPLMRQMYLVARDDASPVTNKFINFVLSNSGQTLLADSDVVRVR
jgi:phosphate transport system substrate-binding protein